LFASPPCGIFWSQVLGVSFGIPTQNRTHLSSLPLKARLERGKAPRRPAWLLLARHTVWFLPLDTPLARKSLRIGTRRFLRGFSPKTHPKQNSARLLATAPQRKLAHR